MPWVSRLLCLVAVLACTSTASAAPVKETPVAFTVRNVDQTALKCETDGAQYTIRGHLVGTRRAIKRTDNVALYLHGLGFGEFFWRLPQVPGYDFVGQLAQRGHVSVVIDRIGYATSVGPAGNRSCMGGQATIAHQIVGDLRSGKYAGAKTPRFPHVALVGHSAGGTIAELESDTFKDVTLFARLASADQGNSPAIMQATQVALDKCAAGGGQDGAPAQYVFLAPGPDATRASFFSSTPDDVFAAEFPLLTPDPCGEVASYAAAQATNFAVAYRVNVPVLVVQAARDAIFPPPAGADQLKAYTRSPLTRFVTLPSSAHAVTTEADRATLVKKLSRFLRLYDF